MEICFLLFQIRLNAIARVYSLNLQVIWTQLFSILGPTPAQLPRLWPLPQQYSFGTQIVLLSTPFTFSTNINSRILNASIDHYQNIIFAQDYNQALPGMIKELSITVQTTDESLQFGVDESYSLSIDNLGAFLSSTTIYG